MNKSGGDAITCLFLDIGGVLLTNGWDHHALERASDSFNLDFDSLLEQHHLTFETLEMGRLSLGEYLERVVFQEQRPFTRTEFMRFMFAQSSPDLPMLTLMRELKVKYGLKVFAVSNEGRELNAHRIRTFKLDTLFDAFVSSCYVHLRKPDTDFFKLALDLAFVEPSQVLYVENTPMFVGVAQELGIGSILHTGYESTRDQMALLGLDTGEPMTNQDARDPARSER